MRGKRRRIKGETINLIVLLGTYEIEKEIHIVYIDDEWYLKITSRTNMAIPLDLHFS